MPNIATILKAEILRLARKEVRSEVEGLKKASTLYRSEIAALKRRVPEPRLYSPPRGATGAARVKAKASPRWGLRMIRALRSSLLSRQIWFFTL
jgi:hypothetical protein